MLQFNTLTLKNFMSFGNNETVVPLDGDFITLVLGINKDTGGEDSRNGTGKSSILDAICFALFGKVVRDVTNQKLVNKLARKNQAMLVTLQFSKDKYEYLIERGERPSTLRLFRREKGSDEDFRIRDGKTYKFDISQGKTETTEQIIDIIGFDIKLFEYLVANSSESDPFMKLPEEKKKYVIEHLFGFNLLSERAKILKEERKETNKKKIAAESALEATYEANKRIRAQIDEMELRAKTWEKTHKNEIAELKELIGQLEKVDAQEEMETLQMIAQLVDSIKTTKGTRQDANATVRDHERSVRDLERENKEHKREQEKLEGQLDSINKSTCPTCKQHWEPDPEIKKGIEERIEELKQLKAHNDEAKKKAEAELKEAEKTLKEIDDKLNELTQLEEQATEIDLFYETVEEASAADANLKQLRDQLDKIEKKENPHLESIEGLQKKAIKVIDDSEVKELDKLVKHYDLLINLLTNKDSYLRKAIIDRWLPKLNTRINHYLDVLELPHRVTFNPDLTMDIIDFHESFDWGNLSRGQRQRVTLALNFAFQDVFEFMNFPISLLMIDELIDSGICNRGATNALKALKEMCNKKQKRVLLVTHREDISAQIDDVLTVVLEHKLSKISQEESQHAD